MYNKEEFKDFLNQQKICHNKITRVTNRNNGELGRLDKQIQRKLNEHKA